MHPLWFEMKQRENLKYQRVPICLSHISGKLFSKTENEKFKVLIRKENSKVLRPHSKLKDGSQLIQTAQKPIQPEHSGFHRSSNSSRAGFVWNSSTPWIQTLTWTEMQSRSAAEVKDISHHRPRDPTCTMQVWSLNQHSVIQRLGATTFKF